MYHAHKEENQWKCIENGGAKKKKKKCEIIHLTHLFHSHSVFFPCNGIIKILNSAIKMTVIVFSVFVIQLKIEIAAFCMSVWVIARMALLLCYWIGH